MQIKKQNRKPFHLPIEISPSTSDEGAFFVPEIRTTYLKVRMLLILGCNSIETSLYQNMLPAYFRQEGGLFCLEGEMATTKTQLLVDEHASEISALLAKHLSGYGCGFDIEITPTEKKSGERLVEVIIYEDEEDKNGASN